MHIVVLLITQMEILRAERSIEQELIAQTRDEFWIYELKVYFFILKFLAIAKN